MSYMICITRSNYTIAIRSDKQRVCWSFLQNTGLRSCHFCFVSEFLPQSQCASLSVSAPSCLLPRVGALNGHVPSEVVGWSGWSRSWILMYGVASFTICRSLSSTQRHSPKFRTSRDCAHGRRQCCAAVKLKLRGSRWKIFCGKLDKLENRFQQLGSAGPHLQKSEKVRAPHIQLIQRQLLTPFCVHIKMILHSETLNDVDYILCDTTT